MSLKQLVDKVLITLEVGDSTPIFILLSREGTIHRKGNGNPATELPLKQGHSSDGHLEALLMTIDETIFQYAGVIRLPKPLGRESRLTIIFQGREKGTFRSGSFMAPNQRARRMNLLKYLLTRLN